ncbi:ANTAR domain-containing response regulator [Lacibacterium aquatile]|uniref:ANTAR domain-containing response regulator n=1 Tax=Lacibacterium aquatile TaxID=1168082 RepID=A0ABW5DV18_9PROT
MQRAMSLRVLLVDHHSERAAAMADLLGREGFSIVATVTGPTSLAAKIDDLKPDVVVLDLASPDRDALEALRLAGNEAPLPMVMFCKEGDDGLVMEAMRAGVTAYAMDGVQVERLKPLLDLAIAQFRQFQHLREERDAARQTLADRKLIDRAKGILMKRKSCDEETAYAFLRKTAMDRGVKLNTLASDIIAMEDLLK